MHVRVAAIVWWCRLRGFVGSQALACRRVLSPLWGRLIRRKVPCSRCKVDMRKVGVGLASCEQRLLQDYTTPGGQHGVTMGGAIAAYAYCPSCAALAANLDTQVSDLQALINAGGIPLEPGQIKQP